jgi:hypothetical protein
MEDEVTEGDEDFNTELNNAITASTQEAKEILNDVPEQEEEIVNHVTTIEDEVYPSLSDEEINNMNMNEWERNLDTDDEDFSNMEITEEEETQNFSTIENETVNIFQDNQFDGFVPEPFATPEEVEKFNLDEMMPVEVFENKPEETPIVDDSFWRDHLHEESEEDTLKKKS